ncbi:MAG: histidinol dehydrogenase, partial [Gammaproteobacteria bacterium]|nr:histidinol dehydrogenase [Gammaproteobacteria bacterium]
MLDITSLNYTDADFNQQLDDVLAWDASIDGDVTKIVADILTDVKKRGNAAVIEYTNKFDRMSIADAAEFELDKLQLQQALESIDAEQRKALETAALRIRQYAERQKMESWSYTEEDGTVLGQSVTPMDRVGLYVPGGKAAYPSSVLMNAIPAKVAGVPELIMV